MPEQASDRRCPMHRIPFVTEPGGSTADALPLPPGPRGKWLVGVLPDLHREGVDFRLRMLCEYGDVVRYRFLGRTSIAIHHPDYVEHVLVHNHDNYTKAILPGSSAKTLLGKGLLTSEGDLWKKQRRLAQPAFSPAHLAEMGPLMTECVNDLVRRWTRELPERLDVAAEMNQLALRIVGKALFSQDLAGRESSIAACFSTMIDRAFLPPGRSRLYFVLWQNLPLLPRPRDRTFEREYNRLIAFIDQIIEQRRGSAEDHGDLLSRLMAARDEGGRGMEAAQLRDEAITMLLAGHETVAVALSWTWYLLAQNPTVEARLHQEVDSLLPSGKPATVADLPKLPNTERILLESMRLFPPVPALTRRALADDEIGGYRVPAGTVIVISPYAIHRHPKLWDHPQRFDPDRFRNEHERERSAFAYLPFGAGPRRCIGQGFAQLELQVILATIARNFRLTSVADHTVRPEVHGTLRPAGGLPMRLEPRH